MNEDRCAERQTLWVRLKDRFRGPIVLQRIEDLSESRIPPLCQVHFFQEIPDTAVAVSPVEDPVGPQALLGNGPVCSRMADDLNAVREDTDLDGLPYIVPLSTAFPASRVLMLVGTAKVVLLYL